MWTEALRRAGVDFAAMEVPNCQIKVARSLEMGWNYVRVDDARTRRLASAFHKVEENLDALRAWERKA